MATLVRRCSHGVLIIVRLVFLMGQKNSARSFWVSKDSGQNYNIKCKIQHTAGSKAIGFCSPCNQILVVGSL